MSGQPVRTLSGDVRETTGRTSPPFKGAVRCPACDGDVRPNLTYEMRAASVSLGPRSRIRPIGGRSAANCGGFRSCAADVQRDVQSRGGLRALRTR
jgi:hypothetical protein